MCWSKEHLFLPNRIRLVGSQMPAFTRTLVPLTINLQLPLQQQGPWGEEEKKKKNPYVDYGEVCFQACLSGSSNIAQIFNIQ